MKSIVFLICLFCYDLAMSQNSKWLIGWGYNRSIYSKSDITLEGEGYKYTIKQAKATDRQSDFDPKVYLSPSKFTIPQYNFTVGYFIKPNLLLSISDDHMKYVLRTPQLVRVKGYVDPIASPTHAANYNDSLVNLSPDFLQFEHTDGLNYIHFEATLSHRLLESSNKKLKIDAFTGPGIGILYPKTNARLFGYKGTDEFKVAGYGLSTTGGLNLTFFNRFILRLNGKGGFISMPWISTDKTKGDKGHQHFFFLEGFWQLGVVF